MDPQISTSVSSSVPPLIPITHDLLHDAIRQKDINRVSSLLLDVNLRPCYLNPVINCFTLAHAKSIPEILQLLLTHCCAGINAIYANGDTLLIRDIKENGFKNFKLLTDTVGVDVNKYNLDGLTALHYAALVRKSPSAIIRRLIELKADVNKEIKYLRKYATDKNLMYELRDATPLICLLRNFDPNYDGFEKVQLLVSNGAHVDVETKDGRTALMYAAGIKVNVSSNIGLIKYLFDNGAVAGLTSDFNENALVFLISTLKALNFSEEDTERLIHNYYIKVIEMLTDRGEDLFIGVHKIGSIFYGIINAYNNNKYLKKLILYFARKQIEMLIKTEIKQKHLSVDYQMYPLEAMVKSIHSLVIDQELLEEILHLIILCPVKEFKGFRPSTDNSRIPITEKLQWRLPRLDVFYTDAKYHNVSSIVVKYLALNKLENALEMLRYNHFHFTGDELCLLLVRSIVEKEEDENMLLQLVDYFIRNADTFQNNFSSSILTVSPIVRTVKQAIDAPDCAWLAALTGNVPILKKFLPYCATHPLAIILLMHPYIEKEDIELTMLDTMDSILPTLTSAENELTNELRIAIDSYMDKIRYRAYGQNTASTHKKAKYAAVFGSYIHYRQIGS